MILAGDIGGTKINLALFEKKENNLQLLLQAQFASGEYENFSDIIEEFQKKHTLIIDSACFGIAGPIINAACKTTNLPWEITTSELQKILGTSQVHLLNDLEATAYGMLYLNEDEFVTLNPNGIDMQGNRAVIAAGTGLGEAILYFDGEAYQAIGSEGGHTDFAPLSKQQDALLSWLRERYPEHVSYERILSGPGIATLYEFLHESGFAPQSNTMQELTPLEDKSAMISQCALKEKDTLSIATLKLFCEIYGAEAGNLALKSMALGGVYIGGGIAPKILPFLQEPDFIESFMAKGRFKEMLQKIRIKVSLNQETALFGAAHFAKDKL